MVEAPRKILKRKGIRPLKKLSQSFLEDQNIIGKIIAVMDLQRDDVIIEIGAGIGIMTEEIAKTVLKVYAVEIDPRLVEILTERLERYHNVEILQADILKIDFSSLGLNLQRRKIKVVGNIPYNISSQILFQLIDYRRFISRMVLMFQEELAVRICATPGSKEYGIPSVQVDMYTICTRELKIPKQCFYPEPNVMSAVLNMVVRDKPKVDIKDHNFFIKIVRMAFSKRRKTLLNNLKDLLGDGYSYEEIIQALQLSEIDGSRRGETLSVEELGALSNAFLSVKKLIEKS